MPESALPVLYRLQRLCNSNGGGFSSHRHQHLHVVGLVPACGMYVPVPTSYQVLLMLPLVKVQPGVPSLPGLEQPQVPKCLQHECSLSGSLLCSIPPCIPCLRKPLHTQKSVHSMQSLHHGLRHVCRVCRLTLSGLACCTAPSTHSNLSHQATDSKVHQRLTRHVTKCSPCV